MQAIFPALFAQIDSWRIVDFRTDIFSFAEEMGYDFIAFGCCFL